MSIKKGTMPPRYDETFKSGAIKMVTEQGRPSKEVAAELGICVETLKSWLKRAGFQPGATDRQNRNDKRQRELEAEIRSLRKQFAEKDEVIDVLKKSVGIFSKLQKISIILLMLLAPRSLQINYAVSPNLLKRDFAADKPNQKWVGDINYIPTDEGWLYAAIVKDLCLKKIVGYAFSSRIDTNLTVSALKMAVNRQRPQDNLIFHSDRGVQYASAGYREALAEYNITQSMSRKGDSYDNAVAEKLFQLSKV